MAQNEVARKELLEQYKKQTEMAKFMTLRRKKNSNTLKRKNLPVAPKTVPTKGWIEESQLDAQLAAMDAAARAQAESVMKSEIFLGSAEVPEGCFLHDAEDEAASSSHVPRRTQSPLLARPQSLADELEKEEERNSRAPHINGFASENRPATAAVPIRNGNQPNFDESIESMGGTESTEEEWFTEEDNLFEEMLGVEPLVRTEVEMLGKEKAALESDLDQLRREKKELREQKEDFERRHTQLQVEVQRLQDGHKDLQEKLSEVKKERDEILDNYLEQPFDEYCITRKELHQLLMKQQLTALELEKAKEEKLALQKELESRRTIFERLRERWRKLFSAKAPQATIAHEMTDKIVKGPVLLPILRDISSTLKKGSFAIRKEWLVSHDSQVMLNRLPHWIGQITLKGMETDRIECSVVARIFQSPIGALPENTNASPHQKVALLSSLQQLHAEVWVATIEASAARIEIIDVIARPPKVRQRFVIKPKTSHIVCMKSIPGLVEESHEFVDSAVLSQETEWIDNSFASPSRRSSSYLGPRVSLKGRERPKSAPKDRTTNLMASTPNLCSLSSASDPGPMNPELLFSSYSPETRHKSYSKKPKPGHHNLLQQQDNTDTSSTCSLTTIDEAADLEEDLPSKMEKKKTEQIVPAAQEEEKGTREGGSSPGGVISPTSNDSTEDYVDISVVQSREAAKDSEPLTSTPVDKKQTSSERRYTVGVRPVLAPQEAPRFKIDELDYDCTDGGDVRTTSQEHSPVMWIITESNDLLFYPTTDPSHRPINRVKLAERAICLEYMKEFSGQRPRVFIGHAQSTISVYHMDEFQTSMWDIDNPERITLPCANFNERHDVRCIAAVGDRIWAGAGPSIFFLNAEMPMIREGSVFLDNYRRRPEKLLPLDNVVIVSTKGSVFYVFDALSARAVQKFDVSHITNRLDHPIPLDLRPGSPRFISAPTDIKTMTSDGHLLYIGTSNGKIVTVPISALKKSSSEQKFVLSQSVEIQEAETVAFKAPVKKDKGTPERPKKERHSKGNPKEKEEKMSKKDREKKEERKDRAMKEERFLREKEEQKLLREKIEEEKALKEKKVMAESHCLQYSAVAVHSHMDERVRDILFLKLPESSLSKQKQAVEMMQYHSLPNLASPLGGRIPISPPILGYQSLVISTGKGHVEYVGERMEDAGGEEGALVHRERHEAFQLLVWGHKTSM